MSTEKELKATSIPADLTYNLMEHYTLGWVQNRTPNFYRIVFFTIADALKFYKSKKESVGFTLKDDKGNFKIGAILTYHAPEDGADGDDKGNYTLEFTLKEEDMNGVSVSIDNHSDLFAKCSATNADNIMNGRFLSLEYCNCLFVEAIDTLVKFLDANASEAEEYSVVLDGVFIATVSVEGGEKVISIVPGEMIKQFIKGDGSM